jgi:hypothetical protein
VSRRDLAHVMTALADAARAEAGVDVAITVIDEAIGRSRGDMRTPLNLQSLQADGLVRESAPGQWCLTAEGVERMRSDEELSRR